ncbi:MAG: hypothetical protein RR101_11595 [Burkholderiaceae bacterium]
MSMKSAELELHKGKKITNALATKGNPFGSANAAPLDRKAQREAERAAGLVPFAVKLEADLARDVRSRAEATGKTLNEVTADLLKAGLAAK